MTEPYDAAVDSALERGENAEERLRYLTTKRIDPLQESLESYWNSLNAEQITERLQGERK